MSFDDKLLTLRKKLFQILIFLLPTQLTLHLWPHWAHVFGIRVDYLAPTLYLTDLLLFVIFFLFAFNKQRSVKKKFIRKVNTPLVIVFVGFILVNIFLAANKAPAILKWFKLIELSILVFYISSEKKFDFGSWLLKPLSYSLILFSLIGAYQFLLQSTIGGFFYYLGERSFSAQTPGIALVDLFGQQYMRAYSTFSHPNSLAGYFLVGLILLIGFKSELRLGKLKLLSIMFGFLAIALSFSLGTCLAVGMVVMLFVWRKRKSAFRFIVSAIFYLAMVISLLSPFIFYKTFTKGIDLPEKYSKRIELTKVSGMLFAQKPFAGVGLNNFITSLSEASVNTSVIWWLQPVHNIFLLVISETGLVGFMFFFYLIYFAIKNSQDTKRWQLAVAIVAIILTGLVDHYWLTLQQNQLLFSVVLGLSFRKSLG